MVLSRISAAWRPWIAGIALCAGSPAAASPFPPGPQDSEARAEVEALGGRVTPLAAGSRQLDVDFHVAGRALEDRDLSCLSRLGGIVRLNLGGTQVTDEGLARLAQLDGLVHLDLSRTAVRGPGLAHLAGMRQLAYLNLYGTQVDDDALRHLEALPALRKVFLWQSRVTPEGAGRLLQACPELAVNLGAGVVVSAPLPAHEFSPERTAEARALLAAHGAPVQLLALDGTACRVDFHLRPESVTPETLAALIEIPDLVEVHLGGTAVGDEDLALVGRVTTLELLHLQETSLTSAGLRHLAPLRRLRTLNLHSTAVTDEGLVHLQPLAALERLFVWNTPVTAEGAARLAAARRGLLVQQGWDPAVPPKVPEPAGKPVTRREPTCCEKAEAAGEECPHPCCVEARAQGKLCEKCNPPGDGQ